MANGTVNIRIGAQDRASSVITSLMKKFSDFSKTTVKSMHESIEAFKSRTLALRNSLVSESDAFERMRKSALSSYETLDQIATRIDAPKRAAQAQEEHNKALERYNKLLEEAKARERARYAKSHFYNAFDPSTHGNIRKGEVGASANGAETASKGIMSMAASARRAIPALLLMNRAMGEGNDTMSKLGGAVSSVAGLFMAFGPAGAVIGAAQAGIDAISAHFTDKADKMVATAQKAAERMAERLSLKKEAKFESLATGLETVANAADKAAAAFERMATRQKEMRGAAGRLASAIGASELDAMARGRARDVDGSPESDKARVAAEWDFKIAERKAEIEAEAAERNREAEAESLRTAEQRLALTNKNAAALERAAEAAFNKYQDVRNVFGETDRAYVKRVESEARRAANRAARERESARQQQDALDIQRDDFATSEITRANEAANATESVRSAARAAADERQKAEIAAAQAVAKERARLEQEAHDQRMADLRAEIAEQTKAAAQQRSVAAAAQSEFDKAFAMYRDPSRAAAVIGEEQDYRNDLDRLHKDARRYGGKWRIDELSSLMAAGDTQGVSDTLATWRKSKGFTPEVEAMVRASAAEQTKTTAEDELKKVNAELEKLSADLQSLASDRNAKLDGIERNTSGLAAKVDELLTVKG